FLYVELIEKIVRSIAAARANDGANVFAEKHFLQFAGATFHRPGKVQIAFQDGVEIERLVTQIPQSLTAGLKHLPVHIAGGRHNADGVAPAQAAWFAARDLRSFRHAMLNLK